MLPVCAESPSIRTSKCLAHSRTRGGQARTQQRDPTAPGTAWSSEERHTWPGVTVSRDMELTGCHFESTVVKSKNWFHVFRELGAC